METKIKNYLLVFGLGIITLTSCNHSKEQDIVASNFAFAEQQLNDMPETAECPSPSTLEMKRSFTGNPDE